MKKTVYIYMYVCVRISSDDNSKANKNQLVCLRFIKESREGERRRKKSET